jgi:hypothetical protein
VITTGLVLPTDSRVPATLAVRAARVAERQPWQESYVSRFVPTGDARDRDAWFHFCTGHHVQFLYWEATLLACERVVSAVEANDGRAVEHWLARVGTLIRGSGAMLHFCAAFDPGRYDPCLRSSMAAERDDFSGDMSRDFLAMMRARARMSAVLQEHREQHAEALAALAKSDAYWRERHTQVVMSLHPGSSLLRDKLARLRREREAFEAAHYIATVVHSAQALADYDDYFGVVRSEDMKVGDYWTQAVEKLAAVHRGFALDAEARTALMRGDAVLLAIISEALVADSA